MFWKTAVTDVFAWLVRKQFTTTSVSSLFVQGYFIKSYPKSNYKNLLNGRAKLTAFLTLFLFISLLAEKTDFSNQESGDNNNIGNVFISPVIGR